MQNTIEVLTIVKTSDGAGEVNYSVNGSLPLDEAARALVIVAFQAQPPIGNKLTEVPKEVDT